jgi:hypothetical protein
MKVIVKTIVHLKDAKRWEKICEHGGDCDYGDTYMERRIPDPVNPYELVPDDHKYRYVRESLELIHDVYYLKHLYFEE